MYKNLYDKYELLTAPEAKYIRKHIDNVVKRIFEKYKEYSPTQIEAIIRASVGMISAETRVRNAAIEKEKELTK